MQQEHIKIPHKNFEFEFVKTHTGLQILSTSITARTHKNSVHTTLSSQFQYTHKTHGGLKIEQKTPNQHQNEEHNVKTKHKQKIP